jgi:hypothetical protein
LKKYLPFILLGLTLYFSSCCNSDSCIQVGGIPVSFSGFPAEELDTVYTIGYERNTGFSKILRDTVADTVQQSYSNAGAFVLKTRAASAGTSGALAGSTLSADYDWEIYIPSVNKRVRLSNYTFLTYTCHKCPRGNDEQVSSIAAVAQNGTFVSVDAVVIYH